MSRTSAAAVACAALIALAGCHDEDWLQYSWDGRRIVCSHSIDNIAPRDEPWGVIADQLQIARWRGSAALFHAHIPEVTVSIALASAV